MTSGESYSGSEYWNDYHANHILTYPRDREQGHKWLDCFLPTLEKHGVSRVLDLGCGVGDDTLELARCGFEVTATDVSATAIDHAGKRATAEGLSVRFERQDAARPLEFEDAGFDAIISNLTLHMFPQQVAERIVAEIHRCLPAGGLFLFHVNSTADIPQRTRQQAPAVRLADDFYRLGEGQTMRFFSEQNCRDLVWGWTVLHLEHIRSPGPDGKLQKCAWRCIAQKS